MKWLNIVLVLFAFFLAGAEVSAQRTTQVSEVLDFNEPTIVEGAAWLKRDDGSLHGRVMTNVATAGDPYTVWWIIFNAPDLCTAGPGGAGGLCGSADAAPGSPSDPAVLYASAAISAPSEEGGGSINTDIWLEAGESSEDGAGPCCRGILNLGNGKAAEVHVIVAEHPNFTSWTTDLTTPQANHRFAVFPPEGADDDEGGGGPGGGAGLSGANMTQSWEYDGGLLERPNAFAVGAGDELSGVTLSSIDVDVSANALRLDGTQGLFFSSGGFNGHVYTNIDGAPAITGVTVNGATTVPGLDATRIQFDSTTIRIDCSGLDVGAGAVLVLDIATSG